MRMIGMIIICYWKQTSFILRLFHVQFHLFLYLQKSNFQKTSLSQNFQPFCFNYHTWLTNNLFTCNHYNHFFSFKKVSFFGPVSSTFHDYMTELTFRECFMNRFPSRINSSAMGWGRQCKLGHLKCISLHRWGFGSWWTTMYCMFDLVLVHNASGALQSLFVF